MGAPAISAPARPARRSSPATKPKPKPKGRPAAKPRSRTAAKPKARATASKRPAAKRAASASTARSKPAASRTRRAPAPARRASVSTAPRALTPVVAVGGLADCGVVMGMTRSRLWIGVLGVLLGGIVALNVWGLSLSASSSATASKIDSLERENSVLRARGATRLSNERVEAAATALGLSVPAADQVKYLKAGDGDAARAAKRLAEGAITIGAAVGTITTAVDPALDPVTGTPIDPLADPATPVDPVADPAAPVDPATVAPAEVAAPPETTEPPVTEAPVTDPAAATPTADPADSGAVVAP
jgi:hypothetical protein